MDGESMDTGDDASSSGSVASFVCDICQGFGDVKNPRGFILKIQPEDDFRVYDDTCYVYVYVHHPDLDTLLVSEEEGCNVCAVICSSFREYGFDARLNRQLQVDLDSPASKSKQPESVANTTPTNDETLSATWFAGVMKQERGFTRERLINYNNGRIVLIMDRNQESGPRGSTKPTNFVGAWALGTPLRSAWTAFFTVFNSAYDPLDANLKHRPSRDLLSGAHIGLINRWRDTCKMEHKSCRETAYNQPLPSRVIEVFETGDRQDPCGIRLIDTHGIMQGTYVCLSYCWGDLKARNQAGQTTTANLSKQLQAIPSNSLPKTIVDAVRLCHKLGFRFLWVDRLCIVQDDKEDWRKEASQMCDIYSRSALTISVPLCIHSSQSFVQKRQNPRRIDQNGNFATIDYIDKESNSNRGLCFFTVKKANWFLTHHWGTSTFPADLPKGNHWITRAWTFQEWMLSPRVLHIDTMTLWDCFEGYANELNRRYVEESIIPRDPKEFGKNKSWDRTVEEYSSREITYEEDRLPAIDGLAVRFHHNTGYTYLAGLWLEEMPRSLLWQRDTYTEATTPVNRTVPSWSWACLKAKAVWRSVERRAAARFNPYASIYHWPGSPISVSMHEKIWIDIKGHISVVIEQKPAVHEVEEVRPILPTLRTSSIKVGNEWWKSVPDHGPKYPDDEISRSNVYLMVLGSVDSSYQPGKILYGGLVLHRCGWDNGRPCFRRLGIATFSNLHLDTMPELNFQSGSSWELQVVHLI